jgi:hypothetical protein
LALTFVVGALSLPLDLEASEVTGLDSILQIRAGTTLNFEF